MITAGASSGVDPTLTIVLPCFNEADNVKLVYERVTDACDSVDCEIVFVDDGSTDATAAEVARLRQGDPRVRLLRFLRNAGQQNAIRAGYRAARGKWILTMDADLQHPASAIPLMLAKAREGYDVVQMVRGGTQRGLWKNALSRSFYKVFNALSDVPIVENGSDFRLISRYVCDVLNSLPERNLVVRAILPYLGFRTAVVPYSVGERIHGTAGYSFRKSLDLGSDTIFEFTAFPLKLAMRVGLTISILAFAYGLFQIGVRLLTDWNVRGYTDIIAWTLFLGGLMLMYLGIIGRYVLVILDHLKRRPEYLLVQEVERTPTEAGESHPPADQSPRPPTLSGTPGS